MMIVALRGNRTSYPAKIKRMLIGRRVLDQDKKAAVFINIAVRKQQVCKV